MGLTSLLSRSNRLEVKTLIGKARRAHQGGGLMLWTVFKILMAVWMLQMVLHFGESAMLVGESVILVVVVSMLAALVRRITRRTSFS
jgi:hypothetical protein